MSKEDMSGLDEAFDGSDETAKTEVIPEKNKFTYQRVMMLSKTMSMLEVTCIL